MNRVIDRNLECLNISKEYVQGSSTVSVFKNVSISFSPAVSYAITGVSGSGKSTLLHLLSGLETPTEGNVLFNGVNIAHVKQRQKQHFLNSTVGLMFQAHYLIKELSVLENVMLAGMLKGERKASCMHRAQNLLELVGLSDYAATHPALLSGGQQQRVSLARALFNKPLFLLADEPTGNLDAENAQAVMALLFAAQKEWGMGIIVCTHDTVVSNMMSVEYRVGHGALSLVRMDPRS